MTTIILVTVGILLAAAAALMVIFYGGDAFGAGSVQAQANTAIGKVQQVSYALQLRQASTGRPMSASTYQTNQTTLVSEGWLDASLKDGVVTVECGGFGAGPVDHVYTIIGSDASASEVCRAVETQAGFKGPVETISAPAGWKAAAAKRGRFGCFRYFSGVYVVIDHV